MKEEGTPAGCLQLGVLSMGLKTRKGKLVLSCQRREAPLPQLSPVFHDLLEEKGHLLTLCLHPLPPAGALGQATACGTAGSGGARARGWKVEGEPRPPALENTEKMTCSSCPGARLLPRLQSGRDKSPGCRHGFRNNLGPKEY